MRGIAGSHGASIAQVAIAWLLARKSFTSVLIGATKAHQLDDNLGATDLELTSEEIAALDAVTPLPPVHPNWFIDRLGDQAVTQALA
jgi:aryl-alcohol dehydrogenase-like predicted oxidoreductase